MKGFWIIDEKTFSILTFVEREHETNELNRNEIPLVWQQNKLSFRSFLSIHPKKKKTKPIRVFCWPLSCSSITSFQFDQRSLRQSQRRKGSVSICPDESEHGVFLESVKGKPHKPRRRCDLRTTRGNGVDCDFQESFGEISSTGFLWSGAVLLVDIAAESSFSNVEVTKRGWLDWFLFNVQICEWMVVVFGETLVVLRVLLLCTGFEELFTQLWFYIYKFPRNLHWVLLDVERNVTRLWSVSWR